MVVAAIIGNVTSNISVELHFHAPESLHTKFDSKWPSSF